VQFEDLLPEQYRDAWTQESGTSWQGAASGSSDLQDVLAAAVEAAVRRLS
jgi:hypothetical protein